STRRLRTHPAFKQGAAFSPLERFRTTATRLKPGCTQAGIGTCRCLRHAPPSPHAPQDTPVRAAEDAAPLEARLARLEGDLRRLADAAVADPLVHRVRGRVREVGVEEAEPAPGREETRGEVGDERARIAVPAQLRRRVDGADSDAVR